MNPSVGRIVHFHYADLAPLAAIITGVHDETCSLTVFYPDNGPCRQVAVPFAEEPTAYHWSWPPMV